MFFGSVTMPVAVIIKVIDLQLLIYFCRVSSITVHGESNYGDIRSCYGSHGTASYLKEIFSIKFEVTKC